VQSCHWRASDLTDQTLAEKSAVSWNEIVCSVMETERDFAWSDHVVISASVRVSRVALQACYNLSVQYIGFRYAAIFINSSLFDLYRISFENATYGM